jgi:hypothetical protein
VCVSPSVTSCSSFFYTLTKDEPQTLFAGRTYAYICYLQLGQRACMPVCRGSHFELYSCERLEFPCTGPAGMEPSSAALTCVRSSISLARKVTDHKKVS